MSNLNENFLQACKDNNKELIKELIIAGANINTLCEDSVANSIACLYYAVEHNDTSLISFFVDHKVDIKFNKEYVLKRAAIKNNLPFIKILENYDINLFDLDGTAVGLAAGHGNKEVLVYFFDLLEDKKNKKLFNIKTIDNILTSIIFYERDFLLDILFNYAKNNSIIYKYLLKSNELVNSNMLKHIELTVRTQRVNCLDYLLNKSGWEFKKEEVYLYIFSYAAQENKTTILDYIWSEGYYFNENHILSIDDKKPKVNTINHIKNFISKQSLFNELKESLSETEEQKKNKL